MSDRTPIRLLPFRPLVLGLTLALGACSPPAPAPSTDNPYAGGRSYPWSDPTAPTGPNPYAGGRTFPWISPQSGPDTPTVNALSDLSWTSATNAWGPVERDRSNGEQQAGDGRTLTVGGVTFAKGLGVHANSTLTYALGGACTTFTTRVGIDDEVGDRGSVTFEVWADGVKLADSGVRRGTDGAATLTADLTGKRELRLVVTSAADGIDYDHADWLDPQLTCAAPGTGGGLPEGGVRVNFQPSGAPLVPGYTADIGQAFSSARGHGWVREDSLSGTRVGLDMSANTRERYDASVDALRNTLVHMQYPASATGAGTSTPGAWEYVLPSGTYSVTVGVGDPGTALDSTHLIRIEGENAFEPFVPTPSRKFFVSTRRVNVTDGRLSLDAKGGINTKLNFVVIERGDRPSVRYVDPAAYEKMVDLDRAVKVDLSLVTTGVDVNTMTPSSVRLFESATGADVAASRNSSGGRDIVVLDPTLPLKPNTRYTFEITNALRDLEGRAFRPFSTSFVTGSETTDGSTVAFEQVTLPNTVGMGYTAVEVGPDNRLYAATITGEIKRFGINADGTLTAPQVIRSVIDREGGPRSIIGMKFDPTSTSDNLVLWITNNYFWNPAGPEAPDWTGKITRLSGPDLARVEDVVVGLPRSAMDHMTNSIAFRPSEPRVLYFLQGSNTSLGERDGVWRDRPERLLTAAVLRLDTSKITTMPLDVRTAEGGGTYDPYATGAPLTIHASGVRNAYDLVWHTNGQLYVPTNGAGTGGNAPASPTPLPPACARRGYTGPAVPGFTNSDVMNDYLFRISPGGYYGHPNPTRCEFVAFGGNPTAGMDPAQVSKYPVGTLPDPNWRGVAYDFGQHTSANGVIEEYTVLGNSRLKNKLMVVRFSAGRDIIVLTPGAGGDIVSAQTGITGLTNFEPAPLDLVENRENGYIYVAQLDQQNYGSGRITLVRPK